MIKIRKEKVGEGIIGAGVCFIIALACAIIAVTAYQINPALTYTIGIFAIAAVFTLFVFLLAGDYYCYYCKRKVLYRQKKIEVRWSEPAMYTKDQNVEILEAMHTKCHEKAKGKDKEQFDTILEFSQRSSSWRGYH